MEHMQSHYMHLHKVVSMTLCQAHSSLFALEFMAALPSWLTNHTCSYLLKLLMTKFAVFVLKWLSTLFWCVLLVYQYCMGLVYMLLYECRQSSLVLLRGI